MEYFQQLFEKLTHLKKKRNTGRFIAISFIIIILFGTFLLMLPFATNDGQGASPLTALFTATSATCVTGLVIEDTGSYFSLFGQIVILLLIQVGGLGFMSALSLLFLATHKSIGLRNRMLIAESLGISGTGGGVRIMLHLLEFTIVLELIGTVLLSVRFLPEYGLRGLWLALFHSISVVCNAGIDIMGNGLGMKNYGEDPYVLIVLAALMTISGSIGFIVWDDIRVKLVFFKKSQSRERRGVRAFWRSLGMYSKLVISISAALLVCGMLAFLLTEWNNPSFAPDGSVDQKLLSAFFQSATCRTSGFDSFQQMELTEPGKLVCIMLMMVGGASGSTAGGIKVATMGIVIIAAVRTLAGKRSIVVFRRQIEMRTILCAMSLVVLWLLLVFFGSVFVSAYNGLPVLDVIYELSAAYGTVGLTVGVTAEANTITRLLLILYMFFGRVGVMTICTMFMTRIRKSDNITYPTGNVIIG